MNKRTLNAALKALIERLEKTEKFVLAQAPEICKQMVKEEAFNTTMHMAINCILLVVFITIAMIAGLNVLHTTDGNYSVLAIIVACCCSLACLPTSFDIVDNIKNLYLLKRCTKLFLIREFKDLLGR